eukprot:782726-Pelagomonas_calceolata.AAC.6
MQDALTARHKLTSAPADSLRAEAQFRREYDGHVWVRARSGDWWEVSFAFDPVSSVQKLSGHKGFSTWNLKIGP